MGGGGEEREKSEVERRDERLKPSTLKVEEKWRENECEVESASEMDYGGNPLKKLEGKGGHVCYSLNRDAQPTNGKSSLCYLDMDTSI